MLLLSRLCSEAWHHSAQEGCQPSQNDWDLTLKVSFAAGNEASFGALGLASDPGGGNEERTLFEGLGRGSGASLARRTWSSCGISLSGLQPLCRLLWLLHGRRPRRMSWLPRRSFIQIQGRSVPLFFSECP
eukprot:s1253_g7.t2